HTQRSPGANSMGGFANWSTSKTASDGARASRSAPPLDGVDPSTPATLPPFAGAALLPAHPGLPLDGAPSPSALPAAPPSATAGFRGAPSLLHATSSRHTADTKEQPAVHGRPAMTHILFDAPSGAARRCLTATLERREPSFRPLN